VAKRGHLDVPVIGVAKSRLHFPPVPREASKHGGLDPAAFGEAKLSRSRSRHAPPSPSAVLRSWSWKWQGRKLCHNARVIVEPFGRVASARERKPVLLGAFDETSIFRIDPPRQATVHTCSSSASPAPS
jgi:hypothetical protein